MSGEESKSSEVSAGDFHVLKYLKGMMELKCLHTNNDKSESKGQRK
jgi:hypothetical protein